tara:strand:+ start:3005 stop:3205 length:201 start_codon:yes stop_codon:yes gene_type:complete
MQKNIILKLGEFIDIKIHDAGDYDLHGTPVTKVEKPIPLHQKINNQNPALCRIFLFKHYFLRFLLL